MTIKVKAQKLIACFRDNVRKYGVKAALHDMQCRLLNTVVDFQLLKGMTVRMQDVTAPAFFEAPGFDARFVTWEELATYARDATHCMSQEFLRDARVRGDRCYALFDGRSLASYGWYSELPTLLDEHFVLHFDRAYIYMYKGYTLPAYRGKRLHAVGMCRALRAFSEEGRKGLISCVASNNFSSLQSVTRMGYKIFGDVYRIRAGTHAFTYATRGCDEHGFWLQLRQAAGTSEFDMAH